MGQLAPAVECRFLFVQHDGYHLDLRLRHENSRRKYSCRTKTAVADLEEVAVGYNHQADWRNAEEIDKVGMH